MALPPAFKTIADAGLAKFLKSFVPPSRARALEEAKKAAEEAKARGDAADPCDEPAPGNEPAAAEDDASDAGSDDSDELGIADAQKGDSENIKMSATFTSFQFNEGPVTHALVGSRRDGRVLVWSTESWALRFEVGDTMHPALRAWICESPVLREGNRVS